MLRFAQALPIAEAWLAAKDIEVELIRDAVIAKPYGWIFFYQSSDFLRNPDDWKRQLVGNAPFLIDRFSGELRVFGTAYPVETYLDQYERDLPEAHFFAAPEQPTWER
jgi:hypothetical protein